MVGRKLYYELASGDVVLIVPEKHNENAINTTKEQDFQIYDVLQARNPEKIGVIQLEYGQYRGDFELAKSVKVDVGTGELLFNYPVFEPPIATTVVNLRTANAQFVQEISTLKIQNDELTLMLGDALIGGAV